MFELISGYLITFPAFSTETIKTRKSIKYSGDFQVKEKTLIKIALVCSIFGIIILFALTNLFSIIPSKNISEISIDIAQSCNLLDESSVKLTGIVTKISKTKTNSTLFITLESTNSFNLVAFKPNSFDLNKGDFIEVRGKISGENNDPSTKYPSQSIICDEIRKI